MNVKPLVLALAAGCAFGYGSARADVIILPGPGSAADTDNVVFNACTGNILGPALMVQGCLQTDNSVLVDFTGTEDLVVNGGQARIETETGTFDFLRINLDPLTNSAFTNLSFNINAADPGTVTIFADVIDDADVTQSFAVSQAGSNFFHVDAINGQLLQSVSFSGLTALSVDFTDVRQVRIGEQETPLPERGALLLLGTVLGALGVTSRRQKAG